MPATRVIEPHGSEHYRQLLERSEEDQILKPQRSKASLKIIRIVRRSWEKYCRQVLGPYVDPVERLRNIRLRDIQIYMTWLLDTSNMRKLGAMVSRMKVWLMMYRDEVGRPLDNTFEVSDEHGTFTQDLSGLQKLMLSYRVLQNHVEGRLQLGPDPECKRIYQYRPPLPSSQIPVDAGYRGKIVEAGHIVWWQYVRRL